MTMRDEIRTKVLDHAIIVLRNAGTGAPYDTEALAETTDDIVALIRERLLSDAAVEAAGRAKYRTYDTMRDAFPKWEQGVKEYEVKSITAALDAALGKEGE